MGEPRTVSSANGDVGIGKGKGSESEDSPLSGEIYDQRQCSYLRSLSLPPRYKLEAWVTYSLEQDRDEASGKEKEDKREGWVMLAGDELEGGVFVGGGNHQDPVQTHIRVGGGRGSVEGMFEGEYMGDLGREMGCVTIEYRFVLHYRNGLNFQL